MSDSIIKVEGLGKKYIIAHENAGSYTALRDVISRKAKEMIKGKQKTGITKEEFWALKDVSFEIKKGNSVGIIGRNGAGKSTLLKILSRITEPSTGRIEIEGRIASLLEVGTGFHPELTGRENIFLNGAILGMSRVEIRKKFDEIVDFSGVEKFMDTPVKRYSSGMYVRLAFAVAAHLEPEILVIDEVLAVGDAEFQKKCLGKMDDVSKSGRTILFVSHDMNAIQKLCKTSILIDKGQVQAYDESSKVILSYLKTNTATSSWVQTKDLTHPHFKEVQLHVKGQQPNMILEVDFKLYAPVPMNKSFVAFNIRNAYGLIVGQAIPELTPFIEIDKGEKDFKVEIDIAGFVPGEYTVSVWTGTHFTQHYDWQKDVLSFNIVDSPQNDRTFPHPADHGSIVPASRFIKK